jgi:hypothetical protein
LSLIRVKTRRISNLYVLAVLAPGPGRRIAACARSRRPFEPFARGEELRIDGETVRVTRIRRRAERRGDVIVNITEVFTRRPTAPVDNVVRMPVGEHSIVAEFIRYHVLVRVFGGDADAWLAHLRARGCNDGDLRFVHGIRARLRKDPALLISIRRMVDATPFWRAAEA